MLTNERAERIPDEVRGAVRSPLRHLDADEISARAKIETRNREVHVPPISAYRWWARRTETINGAILDAVVRDADPETRLLVVDPFVGGGVIPIAAVIRGHRAYAQDLNPWAVRGLAGMLGLGAVTELAGAADKLGSMAKPILDRAYRTKYSDDTDAEISHTFRVAAVDCPKCRRRLRLFPHALVSLKIRREHRSDDAFLACPKGHLFAGKEQGIQACPKCERPTDPAAEYTPRRVATCPHCGAQTRLDVLARRSSWGWACVLVERVSGGQRELAFPTRAEVRQADQGWEPSLRLPDIPAGQETHVLHRHGFRTWNDIYPPRQRVVIEELLSLAANVSEDETIVRTLRLAIIGSAEMAGHLSRWDRFYLKSYEAMAGHRFNFTTFAAEPNVWGTKKYGRGTVTRRVRSFERAAAWLRSHKAGNLSIEGPLAASAIVETMADAIDVRIVEGSSEHVMLPPDSADVALTDPPYHDDVQYGELSLPLRAWAEFSMDSLDGEALVNGKTGQNVGEHAYTELLTRIFKETCRVLRPSGRLILGYANRDPTAWRALLTSLGNAGFRAAGYTVLHSENETDVAKRHVRACSLDMLMDVVPAGDQPIEQWRPATHPATAEGDFLRIVGDTFLRVGGLDPRDLDDLELKLAGSAFLLGPPIADRDAVVPPVADHRLSQARSVAPG